MSKGFRTFCPEKNTWNTTLYFPTPDSFLNDWEQKIDPTQQSYSALEPVERAKFLLAIQEELLLDEKQIQMKYCAESGLARSRFEMEFARVLHTIQLFASHIEAFQWQKRTEISEQHKSLLKKRIAIGPVLVMGSSNFPLAYSTIGGDSVAALAAGCCVVLKAHEMHLGTSTLVYQCILRAIEKCALPSTVFSHIVDNTYKWAQTFAQHPKIQAIGFTGSIRGGRALMDMAAGRRAPIPVFAEMGSVNPVVVDASIHPEKISEIAEKLAFSITNDAGQFCTKPGLILVHSSHQQLFEKTLLTHLATQTAVPMLHPDIFQKFEARKRAVLKVKGVSAKHAAHQQNGILGLWCLALTDLSTLIEHPSLREEVFGPFAVLSPYDTNEDLQDLFTCLDGQLTLSLFTNETQTLHPSLLQFAQQKIGRVILNGVPTGVSVAEAMHHGGAYPASSDVRFTAVGPDSMLRFTKEICWQIHH